MENLEIPSQNQTEPLDLKWYGKFEQVGSFMAFEYFIGDKNYREEQKQNFLSGEIRNPSLDYPKIDQERLETDETSLLELKNEIITQEPNEIVKQVYRWRINEKIAQLRMVKSAAVGDMRRFDRYSRFVYGEPSLDVFNYTLRKIRNVVNSSLSSEDKNISTAAQNLDELLPPNLPEINISEIPDDDEISLARKHTINKLGDLIDIEDVKADSSTEKYSANEIKKVFQVALDSLLAEEWDVIIDKSSKSGISISQEHKEVRVPESRKLAFSKLRRLVAHEIGTHVSRRLRGERSKLQLLGLGLDRYVKGEEGVATMKEQVLKDKFRDFAGLTGHLAISLAKGLDGTPRDFRDVYTIMEKYFFLKSLLSGKSPDQALQLAQTNAWNRTVRTFRGTDSKTNGVCFTKDIIYREGNIGVWEMIRENPAELNRVSVGKYDPANERHVWILNQLGINESDLEELKN